MAQQRRRSAGECGSHPPAKARHPPVPDRVDPDVQPVQPPGPDAMVDPSPAEPEAHELRTGDDAVLPIGNQRDPHLTLAS